MLINGRYKEYDTKPQLKFSDCGIHFIAVSIIV